jgi:hypothetical protein
MSLVGGEPADLAIKEEWQEAVKFALNGGKADTLEIIRPK